MSTSCSTNQLVTRRSSSACITVSISANLSSEATPLVGSSMISSLGRSASAMATSSSLRLPSGSSMEASSASGNSPTRSSVASTSRSSMVLSSERNQLSSLLRRAAAICTHWRTVCSVNSCGNWKDRPSPRRTILRGAMAVTSLPSKYTLPLAGAR
ncbi:hypothetical protein D3C71_1491970 [compost metagenome]